MLDQGEFGMSQIVYKRSVMGGPGYEQVIHRIVDGQRIFLGSVIAISDYSNDLGIMSKPDLAICMADAVIDRLKELDAKEPVSEPKSIAVRLSEVNELIKKEHMTGRIEQIRTCFETELGNRAAQRVMFVHKDNEFIANWLCERRAFKPPAPMPAYDETYRAVQLYREWLKASIDEDDT